MGDGNLFLGMAAGATAIAANSKNGNLTVSVLLHFCHKDDVHRNHASLKWHEEEQVIGISV